MMFGHISLFRSAFVAATLVAGASGAFAQTPTQVPQMPVAELERALSAPMVPTHLAVAVDVLRASGMSTMFDNAMPNVVGSLRVNVTRQRPELAKDIEEALKVVEADVKKAAEEGLQGAARLMAIRMSEAELKEVLVFLTSPAGKKYVEALPQFMEMAVPYLEVWSQQVGGRLTAVFQSEMAKRGHKL